MPDLEPWTVLSTRTVVTDQWLHLEAQRVRTASGAELDPFYVILEHSWATVVPVLPDGRIVVVEQYRHGAERSTLEFPAGDLDDGEDPATAAARELVEETGYSPLGALMPLGRLFPEPARNRSCGHGFVARIAAEAGALALDPGEAIRVHALTVSELAAAQRSGVFCHAVHVAFLAMARAMLGLSLAEAPRVRGSDGQGSGGRRATSDMP